MQIPTLAMITFAAAFASNVLTGTISASAQQSIVAPRAPAITAEDINSARLGPNPAERPSAPTADQTGKRPPDPEVVRMQILLDRAGASPGVIDGFAGENVQKAIMAFEAMHGMPVDGSVDERVIEALEPGGPVVGHYVIAPEDVAAIVPPIPDDYGEKAKRDFLGYESVAEEIAERFHMDVDLLEALNPGVAFKAGDIVFVTAFGPNRGGQVARIEADKALRQVRAYDEAGQLLAAYPATIGSTETPSPSGTHEVMGVATMPDYTYNPEINFQQGANTEILRIPPGPNGPVGTIWIDLSKPSYGIHGTPEPSLIDKVASHGCVRLTNWDAEELAKMVKPGVTVEFLG
jgi:lipoprotein-anchoring transpeptidase ErfK/SrfK